MWSAVFRELRSAILASSENAVTPGNALGDSFQSAF